MTMHTNSLQKPDSENIPLSKRAKLIMRINKNQINDIKDIEGKEIRLFGNTLKIGSSKVKNFLVVKDLFCRFVMSDHKTSEEDFLNIIQKELRGLKINIKKALCGRSMVISFGKKTLYTRSLMIADLSKEESLKLQEEGVGDKKLYGCGIFLPHKSIDAVNNFKED